LPVKTRLIDELYAGVLDSQAWQEGLRSLAREWHASGVVLASYDGASGDRLRVESEPADLAALAPATVHPRTTLMATSDARLGRSLCLERSRERFVLLWLAGRDEGATIRDPDAQHPLVVHLLRALQLRERVESAHVRSSMLDASVAKVNLALLLLDARGVVLARSVLAGQLLAGDCGVTTDAGGTLRIAATGEPVVDPERTPTRRAAELPLRLPRAGRAPLTLLLSPQAGPASWMAVLCDPECAPQFDLALIAADLGVSAREAEVAAHLCHGLAPAEIARRMRISINTVRSHVKAVYGKTGTHSRVALIRRIATSPAALLRRD